MANETVINYEPPLRKTWETCGKPQLLVIGRHCMGFELAPRENKTHLRVWIAYELASDVPERWLGWIFWKYLRQLVHQANDQRFGESILMVCRRDMRLYQ